MFWHSILSDIHSHINPGILSDIVFFINRGGFSGQFLIWHMAILTISYIIWRSSSSPDIRRIDLLDTRVSIVALKPRHISIESLETMLNMSEPRKYTYWMDFQGQTRMEQEPKTAQWCQTYCLIFFSPSSPMQSFYLCNHIARFS